MISRRFGTAGMSVTRIVYVALAPAARVVCVGAGCAS